MVTRNEDLSLDLASTPSLQKTIQVNATVIGRTLTALMHAVITGLPYGWVVTGLSEIIKQYLKWFYDLSKKKSIHLNHSVVDQ